MADEGKSANDATDWETPSKTYLLLIYTPINLALRHEVPF